MTAAESVQWATGQFSPFLLLPELSNSSIDHLVNSQHHCDTIQSTFYSTVWLQVQKLFPPVVLIPSHPRVCVHAIDQVVHLGVILPPVAFIGLCDEHCHSDQEEEQAKEQDSE